MNTPSLSDHELHGEVAGDLKAAIGARRELGAEMEDPILEAFLARVMLRIDARVAEQVTQTGSRSGSHRVERGHGRYEGAVVVVGSLVLSVPLLGVAGDVAQGFGVAAVMLAIIVLNVMYFAVGRD